MDRERPRKNLLPMVVDGPRRRPVCSPRRGPDLRMSMPIIRCVTRRALVVACALACLTTRLVAQPTSTTGLVIRHITASSLDPAIRRFDNPHYIVFDSTVGPNAPLLVFLPGTGG